MFKLEKKSSYSQNSKISRQKFTLFELYPDKKEHNSDDILGKLIGKFLLTVYFDSRAYFDKKASMSISRHSLLGSLLPP